MARLRTLSRRHVVRNQLFAVISCFVASFVDSHIFRSTMYIVHSSLLYIRARYIYSAFYLFCQLNPKYANILCILLYVSVHTHTYNIQGSTIALLCTLYLVLYVHRTSTYMRGALHNSASSIPVPCTYLYHVHMYIVHTCTAMCTYLYVRVLEIPGRLALVVD